MDGGEVGAAWALAMCKLQDIRSKINAEERLQLSLELPMICRLIESTASDSWEDFETSSKIKHKCNNTLGVDLHVYHQSLEPPPGKSVWTLEDIPLLARKANESAPADLDGSPRRIWTRIYWNGHLGRLLIGPRGFVVRWLVGESQTLGYMMWDGGRIEEWRLNAMPTNYP